ncbi:hypothetical protein ACIQ6V_33755 [Streptomyces sp. NPDC096198]|uniref:hypothetical protein n=1 Tax=Streptomyces sp. NPDC096198 TaxID=3366080 RepID=UPI003804BDB2
MTLAAIGSIMEGIGAFQSVWEVAKSSTQSKFSNPTTVGAPPKAFLPPAVAGRKDITSVPGSEKKRFIEGVWYTHTKATQNIMTVFPFTIYYTTRKLNADAFAEEVDARARALRETDVEGGRVLHSSAEQLRAMKDKYWITAFTMNETTVVTKDGKQWRRASDIGYSISGNFTITGGVKDADGSALVRLIMDWTEEYSVLGTYRYFGALNFTVGSNGLLQMFADSDLEREPLDKFALRFRETQVSGWQNN